MDVDGKKLEVVLECLVLDNPRSARDYTDNLLTWSLEELIEYRDRRKSQIEGIPKSPFRPHP
jgi:hypothetical protein